MFIFLYCFFPIYSIFQETRGWKLMKKSPIKIASQVFTRLFWVMLSICCTSAQRKNVFKSAVNYLQPYSIQSLSMFFWWYVKLCVRYFLLQRCDWHDNLLTAGLQIFLLGALKVWTLMFIDTQLLWCKFCYSDTVKIIKCQMLLVCI